MKLIDMISDFFDLNKRYESGYNNNNHVVGDSLSEDTEETVQLGARETPSQSTKKNNTKRRSKKMTFWEQFLLYLFTALGVCLSSIIKTYHKNEQVSINISIPIIGVSFFIALMLMPVVYEKLVIAPNTPLIVRLGLFFQTGVFWHTIIDFGSGIAK